MAPLHDVEHGARSVYPGNNDGVYVVVTSSAVVVVVDHGHGKDDGEPSGWTECWLGLEVSVENPEPAWRMPKRHSTTSADGGASWIAGQTSNLARSAISSTGLLWRQDAAGFAVLGIARSRSGDTIAGGHG
jgi:hypothetical protein